MNGRLIKKRFTVVALTLCAASAGYGQRTVPWDGGGTQNDWHDYLNWDVQNANQLPDSNAIALFGEGVSRTSPTLTQNESVRGISFTASTTPYNLNGSSFTLTIGTGGIINSGAAPQNINTNLSLSGAQTWTTTGNLTITGTVSGTGPLTKDGSGTLLLTGDNYYSGTTTISSGTLQVGFNSTTGSLGSGAVLNNAALIFHRSNTIEVGNAISGTGSLTQAGSGLLTLTGANSYTGKTTINNGVLVASTLANGGSNSSIGASSNAAGSLVLNGGTLRYTGAGATTNRLFTLGTNGGTLDASGSGALNLTNTGNVGFSGTGSRTLTLTGTNTGSNILAAAIRDNGGSTSLIKNGPGQWVLSGTNTFSGATTVNAGTLTAGATNALGGTTSVTVNSGGTLLLAGNGTDKNRIKNSAGLTLAGGKLDLAGLSETESSGAGVGTLTLTANSVIDFGTTASGQTNTILWFTGGSYSGGTLTIQNWTPLGGTDQLRFTNATGLTPAFLNNVTFSGFGSGAQLVNHGDYYEMVPVPEPSTIIAGIGLVGILGWRERRRIGSLLKRSSGADAPVTA